MDQCILDSWGREIPNEDIHSFISNSFNLPINVRHTKEGQVDDSQRHKARSKPSRPFVVKLKGLFFGSGLELILRVPFFYPPPRLESSRDNTPRNLKRLGLWLCITCNSPRKLHLITRQVAAAVRGYMMVDAESETHFLDREIALSVWIWITIESGWSLKETLNLASQFETSAMISPLCSWIGSFGVFKVHGL